MNKIDFEHLSNISRAISHPERSQIVELLSADHCNVTEIVRKTGISQPKVSGHLSKLQSAGIVESVRSGKEIIYSIVPETLENLAAWIDGLAGLKNKESYTEREDHHLVERDFSFARCCYDHLAGNDFDSHIKFFLYVALFKVHIAFSYNGRKEYRKNTAIYHK